MSTAFAEIPLEPAGGGPIAAQRRRRHSLRVRPVPPLEPPYDPIDDPNEPRPSLRPTGSHLLAPPLAPTLPFERPVPRRVTMAENFWGPQPTERRQLPDPRPMAARFLQATLEAMAGRRPANQLRPLMSRAVYEGVLERRTQRPPGGSPVPVVRSVHVSEPLDGVAEVAAVIQHDERFHAVAARFEGFDGRWRCVTLQIG